MVAVFLLMFVAGIGLTQAVSDPKQVTLRWLRLGGIIALSLLGVAAVVWFQGRTQFDLYIVAGLLFAAAFCLMQLVFVQLGHRTAQRSLALLMTIAALIAVEIALTEQLARAQIFDELWGRHIRVGDLTSDVFLAWRPSLIVAGFISSGLLGGCLMTMLLGHAYLTAGNEMTQSPFRRLVILLAIFLVARAVVAGAFGLLPYWTNYEITFRDRLWNTVMISSRFLVGLALPMVFTYMVYDCVQRRANQSATGILYVAGVLVVVGEGIALALLAATGLVF